MVITGGSTGMGLVSAQALALGGATVVLTARTNKKGQAAVQKVQDYLQQHGVTNNNNNNNVYAVQLDLDDLANVKSFPDRLTQVLAGRKVDVLMNNAGVMAIPERQVTKDGYERTFQSNHLGHFVLTAQLTPLMQNRARIVNVSSAAHLIASQGGL